MAFYILAFFRMVTILSSKIPSCYYCCSILNFSCHCLKSTVGAVIVILLISSGKLISTGVSGDASLY